MKVQLPDGVRRTKQREWILAVLEKAKTPMTAADIYALVVAEHKGMSLSTVYRVLEFFEEHDVVARTSVMNSDMAYYELCSRPHTHYAVCVRCSKIVSISNCPLHQFTPDLSDSDFKVLGHRMEMYGYCKDCTGADKKEN